MRVSSGDNRQLLRYFSNMYVYVCIELEIYTHKEIDE